MALLLFFGSVIGVTLAAFLKKRFYFNVLAGNKNVLIRINWLFLKKEWKISLFEFEKKIFENLGKTKKKSSVPLRKIVKRGCTELVELCVTGRIGIVNDAAKTAFLCGVMNVFAETVLKEMGAKKVYIRFVPDFTQDLFWLYMEGRIAVYPRKIAAILIKEKFKEAKK